MGSSQLSLMFGLTGYFLWSCSLSDKCLIRVSTFLFWSYESFWSIVSNLVSFYDCPGMNNREVMDQVSKGYRMPQPANGYVSDPVYHIMIRCWDVDPDRRPTFEFLKHFFDDFPVSSEIPYREVKNRHQSHS